MAAVVDLLPRRRPPRGASGSRRARRGRRRSLRGPEQVSSTSSFAPRGATSRAWRWVVARAGCSWLRPPSPGASCCSSLPGGSAAIVRLAAGAARRRDAPSRGPPSGKGLRSVPPLAAGARARIDEKAKGGSTPRLVPWMKPPASHWLAGRRCRSCASLGMLQAVRCWHGGPRDRWIHVPKICPGHRPSAWAGKNEAPREKLCTAQHVMAAASLLSL